jgi:hypothetical protein
MFILFVVNIIVITSTCLFYCHINYLTFSHHFASDVSFGIIKHVLTRYSGNSKFIDPEIPTIDRGNSWYLGVNKLTIPLIQSISINYLMHCIYFLIYFAISVTWRIVTWYFIISKIFKLEPFFLMSKMLELLEYLNRGYSMSL